MKQRNKRILITGAEGFIGSHLTERLVKLGYNVKAFTLYNSFNSKGWLDHCDKEIKKEIEIISGDIRDPGNVRHAVKNCKIIFHLAALIGIPYSYYSPQSYVDTNIKGTQNIIDAARDFEVENVIHTSTSEVYGTAKFVPITEDHPLKGQSPYSASKIGADQIAMSYYSSYKLPITILRPFNTYGPRQSIRAVIPTIIFQILKGRNSIKLGSVYPTRDFSYIDDTVTAFIKAAKNKKANGEIINIGNNFEISINNTAKVISKLMGKKIYIEEDKKRLRPEDSEVDRLLASNKKAKKILGWKPRYSGLAGFKKGLLKTIKWFSQRKNFSIYNDDSFSL